MLGSHVASTNQWPLALERHPGHLPELVSALPLKNRSAAVAQWINDYIRHSRECRAEAAKAPTEEERDHLLHMANRWEELAHQRAAFMHMEDILNSLLEEDDSNQGGGIPKVSSP